MVTRRVAIKLIGSAAVSAAVMGALPATAAKQQIKISENSNMNQFAINTDRCIQCGVCADTCPMGVIEMNDFPVMEKKECIKCQQCLAVCPEAALSILGDNPDDSTLLEGNLPAPKEMATLIKGRRSVRQYKDKAVAPQTIRELMDVVWNAPTGVNTQSVQLTVMVDKASTDALRDELYNRIDEFVAAGKTSDVHEMEYLKWALNERKTKGKDIIFRGAPHFILASSPQNGPSPLEDTHIFLSYFELMAQSMGLGTCWNGMVKAAVDTVFPDIRKRLGVPEDHVIGYAMTFGTPDVEYYRTVERGPANMVAATWES